jgi:hypothetical protein
MRHLCGEQVERDLNDSDGEGQSVWDQVQIHLLIQADP